MGRNALPDLSATPGLAWLPYIPLALLVWRAASASDARGVVAVRAALWCHATLVLVRSLAFSLTLMPAAPGCGADQPGTAAAAAAAADMTAGGGARGGGGSSGGAWWDSVMRRGGGVGWAWAWGGRAAPASYPPAACFHGVISLEAGVCWMATALLVRFWLGGAAVSSSTRLATWGLGVACIALGVVATRTAYTAEAVMGVVVAQLLVVAATRAKYPAALLAM